MPLHRYLRKAVGIVGRLFQHRDVFLAHHLQLVRRKGRSAVNLCDQLQHMIGILPLGLKRPATHTHAAAGAQCVHAVTNLLAT